jgi:YwiC-like protein
MFPKEHGAYGQLLLPIVTALAIGRPGFAAAALGAAAGCAFLTHEPLLVLLGQRGARAGRELHRTALRWFVGFAASATVLGSAALLTASPEKRFAVVPSIAMTLIVFGIIRSGREHTIAGEAVSAIALASLAYPIGVWSSGSSRASLSCAVAFAAVFVAGVVGVHAVIAFTRRPPATAERAVGAVTAIGAALIVFGLASARILEVVTPLAVLPACAAGLALALWPPSARKLRAIGWTLVSTSVLTMVVLLAAFR